ncbi:hypothetical protein NFJ02_38g96890 [Pycnococcus provasolii]
MAATPMASDVSSTQPKGLGLLSPSAGTYLALQGEGQTDTLTESLIVQGAGAFLALPAPPGALVERVGRVSRLLASCGTTTLSPVDEGNIFANLHERIDWEYLSSLQIDTEYTVDDLLVVSTDPRHHNLCWLPVWSPRSLRAASIAAGRLLEEARRPHAKLEVCIACNGSSPVDRDNISSCVGCGGIVHVECVSVQLEKLGLSANASPPGEEEKLKALVKEGTSKLRFDLEAAATAMEEASGLQTPTAEQIAVRTARLTSLIKDLNPGAREFGGKGASSCGNCSEESAAEFKGKLAQARAEAPPGNSSAPPIGRLRRSRRRLLLPLNGNGEETAVVERLMKVVAELKEQVSDMRQAQKNRYVSTPISTRGVDFLAKKAPDGNVAESPFHIGDVSFFEKFPYLGTSRAGGWTLWQEYMLHDKAPFRCRPQALEEWADADLFNLWCDNVYRHVYDIWIDATTGTGEGIYARNCAHRERNLQMLRMLMSRMAILKLTALYWTREVSLEERWSAGVLLIMLSKRAADWTSSSRQVGEEDQAWWEHLRLADKPTLPSDVSGANGVFVLQHTSAYHVLQARLASGETMQQVSAPFSVYRPMAVSDVASASAVAGKPPPPEGEVAQFDATIHCQHCYRYSRSLINLHPGRTHLEAQLTFAKKLHNRLTFLNKKANDGGDKDDADKDATSEKAAAGGPGK